MKFIHVSDIHIGMTPDAMMPWSDARALDIKESFANVIKKCKVEKADLLLISGDLFNHQPVTSELIEINELFKTIYDTKVLIVAGSSDYIRSSSPVLNFKFSENVFYFLNEFPEEVEIKDTKIVVHGFSYFNPEEKSSMINAINLTNDKKIHILLAYGGDKRHSPIDFDELSRKGFAYCALGSNHKPQVISENKIAYAGSLEPLSSEETGDHGIYIGEILRNSNKPSSLKFEKIAKASYIPITIKINIHTTDEDIFDMVTDEVSKYGKENIFKITIIGERSPDVTFTKDVFDKKVRISNFIDNTEPKYDFAKLLSEHPDDMIGTYIQNFNNRDLSDVEKNALYYGVNALMKTCDRSE